MEGFCQKVQILQLTFSPLVTPDPWALGDDGGQHELAV